MCRRTDNDSHLDIKNAFACHICWYVSMVQYMKISTTILFLFSFHSCICDGIVLKFVHAIRFHFLPFSSLRPQTSNVFFCVAASEWKTLPSVTTLCWCSAASSSFFFHPLKWCFVILAFGGCYFQYLGKHWSWKSFSCESTIFYCVAVVCIWFSVFFAERPFLFPVLGRSLIHSFIHSFGRSFVFSYSITYK